MGVWAGPAWPEAGLGTKPPGSPYLGRRRRAVPRGSPRRPGPETPSPQGPSPGLWAAASPLPALEQRPFGTMGPLPRLWEGRHKGREARPGTEPGVRKVKAAESGETERMAADAATGGQLPRPSSSLPSAPPPRQGRERRPAASQALPRGKRGSHTKNSSTPSLCQRRGPPEALRSPTPAQPESLRGQGPRGAPLSPTHPQLRAPAHGGS